MTAAATDFEPGFTARPREPVGDWMPSRYTKPLRDDFTTHGDKLIRIALKHWSIAEAAVFELDEWQRWLLRAILETYPDDWPVAHLRGQLRYRQVVISMGRQNGKSVLGALIVLYFLGMHVRGPNVIGLASIDDQAKIVYNRVKYAIDGSAGLKREFATSETRGIKRTDRTGKYDTLPAKEDSAQGHPASGVLYDELHLGLAALWDAMLLAMRSISNALMVGLTTAGDDSSELLLRLYDEGEAAIAGEDERFGFFVWEAPSDELTEAGVIAANPAIACGRVPLDVAMADARKMYATLTRGPDGMTGRQRAIRYTLNRFIKGAASAWASAEAWEALSGQVELVGETVYSIERTSSWEAASISATAKIDGELRTELVASIVEPSHAQLRDICAKLAERGPSTFVMPSTTLGKLADELKEAGYEVWKLGVTEEAAAAQNVAGMIRHARVRHAGDELVTQHFTRGRRRDQEAGGWRISRTLSTGDTDALRATVNGLHVADVKPAHVVQLF